MQIEEIKEFCIEHVNDLCQEGREEIFNILRIFIADVDIDSSNADGSRVYIDKISDETFAKLYKIIKMWLEN